MLIVGVDTGLRACGLGIADVFTGRLVHGCLVKNRVDSDNAADVWLGMARAVRDEVLRFRATRANERVRLLIVERQYVAHHPNPNQLIGLMCVVGAVLAAVEAEKKISVFPSQWNRSLKKDRSGRGVWAKLGPVERVNVHGHELKTTGHNVLDGVGIAKWGLTYEAVGEPDAADPSMASR